MTNLGTLYHFSEAEQSEPLRHVEIGEYIGAAELIAHGGKLFKMGEHDYCDTSIALFVLDEQGYRRIE